MTETINTCNNTDAADKADSADMGDSSFSERYISYENETYSDAVMKEAAAAGVSPAAVIGARNAGLWLTENEEGSLMLTDGRITLCPDFRDSLKRLKPNLLNRELLVRAARIRNRHKDTNRMRSPGAHISVEQICAEKTSVSPASQDNDASACITTEPARMTAVDATAGLGEDSILLAAAGFEVTMFEYDPVIAALLQDALIRAAAIPELSEITARMRLIDGDSITGMQSLSFTPDVIVLDPMFPERRKSALIKKKFQLLQKLEQPCSDEAALLSAALNTGAKKIVIKRPVNAPALAGRRPDYTIEGSTIRYDCILGAV